MDIKKEPTVVTRGSEKTQNSNGNNATLADASTKIKWGSYFPILRGFRIGNQIAVHCPWCDRMHFHGWNAQDSSRVVTLRIAHGGHEPPAPSSYRVSVFREKDLQKLGYSPAKRRRARIGGSHKQEGSMELLTPKDRKDENEALRAVYHCCKPTALHLYS